MDETYKLCYIEDNCAYFTTQDVKVQWGDDWNDAPYEYNAGAPYRWNIQSNVEKYEIDFVFFTGNFEKPSDSMIGNSIYSVKEINQGKVAWLRASSVGIYAGTTYPEFVQLVRFAGGDIYTRIEHDIKRG